MIIQKFQAFKDVAAQKYGAFTSKIKRAFDPSTYRSAPQSQAYDNANPFAPQGAMTPPAKAKPTGQYKTFFKGAAVAAGVATVVGGSIAMGVTHALWVPGFLIAMHHVGAAFAALGAAIGAISPVGWVIIGIVGAIALGFAGYSLYTYIQKKKAEKAVQLEKLDHLDTYKQGAYKVA